MRSVTARSHLSLLGFVMGCMLSAAPSLAGPPEPIDTTAMIEAMPRDVGLVVVAEGLRETLASPQGQSLIRAISESGFFRPTGEQWAALSGRLGYSPIEGAAELLGRRVVLVATEASPRSIGRASEGAWGLMTWVSPANERRLIKKLRLTPRRKIGAQPVLAAEQGEFHVTLLGDGGDGWRVLLVSPAAEREMIKPMIEALRAARAAPGAAMIPARAAQADATMRARLREENAGVLDLSVQQSPDGWRVALLSTLPADRRAKIGRREVCAQTFERLAPRALLLLSESVPDRGGDTADTGLVLSSLFTQVPERFRRILGGRTLLMVEDAQSPGAAPSLLLASEASYPGDPVAEGDRAIGALLSPGAGSAPPEGAIEGQYPRAVRTDTLDASSSIFGGRVHAAWAYSPERRAGSRWWALRLSDHAGKTDTFRAFVDALPPEDRQPEGARTIAMGLIRPRALIDQFSNTPWTELAPIRAASNIENVTWSLRLIETPEPGETRLSGVVEIEMRRREASEPGGAP